MQKEQKQIIPYCENFLSMMFANEGDQPIDSALSKAMDLIFLLHADHEQNCSTSTCRMIASGGANPFASLGWSGFSTMGSPSRRSEYGGNKHAE